MNVMSSKLTKESRPSCKSGTLIDLTGKLRSSMMLMKEQHLNYTTPKDTQHKKIF